MLDGKQPDPTVLRSRASRGVLAALLASAPLVTSLLVERMLPDAPDLLILALLFASPLGVFAILAAASSSVRGLWSAPLGTSVAVALLAILIWPISAASGMLARMAVGDLRRFTDSVAHMQAFRRQLTIEQGLTWAFTWSLLFGVTYFVASLTARSLEKRPVEE